MIERNLEITVDHQCDPTNLSMKLIFDLFTPRPHFIIVQRPEYQKLNATDDEMNQLMHLVTDFLVHKPQYDNNAILSFHRGEWYQQNNKHFHAHLCVPTKPYCQEAKLMITLETTGYHWLTSTDYLERLHRASVLSKIKYVKYRDRCFSMSYLCYNDPVSYEVPLHQFNTSKFTLVYLASSPRIGIRVKNTKMNDLISLFKFMNHFYLSARKKLSRINPLYQNFGAHLCLYVSGKKKKNARLIKRTDRVLTGGGDPIKAERLVGYIQMDEQLYLRWLPEMFHRIWLNEFQKSQHLVLT